MYEAPHTEVTFKPNMANNLNTLENLRWEIFCPNVKLQIAWITPDWISSPKIRKTMVNVTTP